MYVNLKRLFVLTLISHGSHMALADVEDCRKPPADAPANFQDCCNVANINLKSFEGKCQNYTTSRLYMGLDYDEHFEYFNACYFECIWNSSSTIQNNAIVLERLEPMLDQYFNKDRQIVDLAHKYIAECSVNVKERIVRWQKAGHLIDTPTFQPKQGLHCSWTPIVTTVCALHKLFLNCPTERKTGLAQCQLVNNYLERCFGAVL